MESLACLCCLESFFNFSETMELQKKKKKSLYVLMAHAQSLTVGILRERNPHRKMEHLYYGQSTEGRISYKLSKVGAG